MKILDFIYLSLYHIYCRTDPALIDYEKPQKHAIYVLSLSFLLPVISFGYFIFIAGAGIMEITNSHLLVFLSILIALLIGIQLFISYRLRRRYTDEKVQALLKQHPKYSIMRMASGALLGLVLFVLPIVLVAATQLWIIKQVK